MARAHTTGKGKEAKPKLGKRSIAASPSSSKSYTAFDSFVRVKWAAATRATERATRRSAELRGIQAEPEAVCAPTTLMNKQGVHQDLM